MKRKEWITLIVALMVIAAAAVGLYQYRSAAGNQGSHEAAQPANPGEKPAQGVTDGNNKSQLEKAPDKPYVRLWVTRDFGTKTLLEKVVPIESKDTVMDVLKHSVGEVKTNHGGGFVEAIDGLATGYRPGDPNSKKLDWFYYVNGKIADVGAAEYPLQTGDVVWWDYHSWEYAVNTPAMVGAFPHPFGIREDEPENIPTIMAASGFEQQAESLAVSIQQVRNEPLKPAAFDEKAFAQEKPLLIVGDVKSISSSAYLQKLWKEKNMVGLFAELNQEGIHVYDDNGKKVKTYTKSGVGVVISTLHPDTRQPLWIVSGTEKDGVEKAVQAMKVTKEWQNELPLHGFFGLLINGDVKLNLPMIQGDGAKK